MRIYSTLQEAATALQTFYQSNAENIQEEQSFSVGDEISECYAKIVKDPASSFHKQNTALEIMIKEGDERSIQKLKCLAEQIHTDLTPVSALGAKALKIGQGKGFGVSQQFIPSSSPYAGLLSAEVFGSSHSSMSGITMSLFQNAPSVQKVIVPKTQEVSNQTFETKFILKDEGLALKALKCTFKDVVCAKGNLDFNEVVCEEIAMSREGHISATHSRFQEVDARGQHKGNVQLHNTSATSVWTDGNVTWKNEEKVKAHSIECKGNVVVKGLDIKKIESEKGSIQVGSAHIHNLIGNTQEVLLDDCSVDELTASGKIILNNGSKVKLLTFELPQVPICEIILDNAEIEELVIRDAPSTKSLAKNSSHKVVGFPASFNYPDKNLKGYLNIHASGRIEGEPYQLFNGKYSPGIKIIFSGTGTIHKITYKNCAVRILEKSDMVKFS